MARIVAWHSRRTCFSLFRVATALLALTFTIPSHAQGCALCRDTTAGSAPRVRQSLRRGIVILGLPASAISSASLSSLAK
ncbi:MAG: hypothetical protein JOZ83_11500 [Silvibacterium sp.]|nr:hypothetical protein [Silvibacterium sp.]